MQIFRPQSAACVGGTFWILLLLYSARPLSAQQAVQQAAFIQPQPVSPTAKVVTAEMIQERRQAAADSADLDDETKKKVDALYAQALDNLKRIAEASSEVERLSSLRESAPQRAQELTETRKQVQESLDALPSDALKFLVALTLAELQTETTRKKTELADRKAEQQAAAGQQDTRDNRRREIIALQNSAKQRADDLQKQLDAQPPAGEPAALTDARRLDLSIRQKLLNSEGPLLQNELAAYDAEASVSIVRLILEISNAEVALAEREIQLLEQKIAAKQAEAAQEAVAKAQAEARNATIAAHVPLKALADRNTELTQDRDALTEPTEKAQADLAETSAKLDEIEKSFSDIQKKVDQLGLTGPIGSLLRRERSTLPDLRRRALRVRERRTQIETEQFKKFQLEDERTKLQAELTNREAKVSAIVNQAVNVSGGVSDAERAAVEDAAAGLLSSQDEYLNELIKQYESFLTTLDALELKEQELIRRTKVFGEYIDERVLWIRSNESLISTLEVDSSDWGLFQLDSWTNLLQRLTEDGGEHLGLFSLCVLLTGMLVVLRPRLRRELVSCGESARKGTCTSIVPTLRSAWLTVLLSILWPGLLLLIGLRLATIAGVSESGRAIGYGLQAVAVIGFSLELFRNICRPHGLADDHFDWPDSSIAVFRNATPKLIALGLPIVFLTTALYQNDSDHRVDLVERLCFVLGTLVLAVFLRRVLRPESGVLREYLEGHRGGWLDRLTTLWYSGSVLSPLVLGGLAAVGFYYTAYQLSWRLFATILLLVAVQLLRAFLERLLIVQQRQIRIEQLRQRREEAAEGSGTEQPAEASPLASVPLDELRAEVEASTEQSRRLLRTALIMLSLVGAWAIWVDVLPALRFIDRWPLWKTTVEVTETETAATTTPTLTDTSSTATDSVTTSSDTTREEIRPVTIVHLTVAILIAILTIAAARNVPGLMELWVLQKLPLDQSVRYAIRALTSYAIVLVGIIFSFKAIYVGWSQVQWLATALTFGLAFGLQEIFANFVAGLILLFERPIRVGDVVTVDDVSGVVSRIRIRATTITNWDRKEYVIPNREFITGRMLNWTLSDKVNRIVINIGIAYGSDTEQARDLLLKICREHPLLLNDPGPNVTFEGFGDNTLNLVLRTYLPDLDNRLGTIHQLHTQINDEFNRAGIEISFPQRDLHIRSIDEDAAKRLRGEKPGD